ncbi:MAG: CU044_5270 family protein [Candidatus Saccharibacteria bacterium]|nr:CU044_5270 family protein [Microbacteriaceae bacterium]
MNTLLGPTEEQVDRIHARLQQSIAHGPARKHQPSNRRHVTVRRAGYIAVVAGALAAGLVITGAIAPQGPGHGDTAQAAELLQNAATATIKTSDPIVGPGQYLRIATNSAYMSQIFHPTGPDTYYLYPTTGTLYIPADRSQQWVWERHNLPITTVFGTPAQKAEVKLGPQPPDPNTDGIFRANAGAFYGTPAQDDHLAAQPRDAQALLAYFQQKATGKGPSENSEIWTLITDELRTGVVPADLRAALYKTAALIPGIAVIGTDVTLDGKTGEAIGLMNGNVRDDIIIDPTTGMMIGERTVALKAGFGIPAGTSVAWTSISTTVAKTAP